MKAKHNFLKKNRISNVRDCIFDKGGVNYTLSLIFNELLRKKISMCIAWPMCIKEVLPGKECIAELDGISRKVSLRLLDGVQAGDHVLVHAGYAIEKIDPAAAQEQLHIMEELKQNITSKN